MSLDAVSHISRREFALKGTATMSAAAISVLAGCKEEKSQSAEIKTLKMQSSWINDAEFLGYFVAMDPDFDSYRRAALKVDYFTGGPQVIPETAILSGKADVALATPETTARYIVRDKVDLRIIGAQYQKNPLA
jgi:hypothetical protein